MSLDKDASILVNSERYGLVKAEGIALKPNKTEFSYSGQTKKFTLYFPPIQPSITTIDFIESPTSTWKIWGIQLK